MRLYFRNYSYFFHSKKLDFGPSFKIRFPFFQMKTKVVKASKKIGRFQQYFYLSKICDSFDLLLSLYGQSRVLKSVLSELISGLCPYKQKNRDLEDLSLPEHNFAQMNLLRALDVRMEEIRGGIPDLVIDLTSDRLIPFGI